mgnify:CR=1 FL=1
MSPNLSQLRKFVSPEIIFGAGCRHHVANYAKTFGARKVLLVSDPGVIVAGWVADIEASLQEQAIDYLAERLTTPLQIEQHLTMALMEGFTTGTKPITVDILEATLSKRIDDIEPRLIRHGYSDKVLVEQFNYKLAEVRRFFKGELDANRAKDITQDLREAGLPI